MKIESIKFTFKIVLLFIIQSVVLIGGLALIGKDAGGELTLTRILAAVGFLVIYYRLLLKPSSVAWIIGGVIEEKDQTND